MDYAVVVALQILSGIATLVIVRVALPVLVRVTLWTGLVVPTDWFPKERLLGERLTAGAVPVPVRLTPWGLPAALSVIVTAAVRLPVAAGVNVTEIVQLAPALTLLPQVLLWAKSAALVPVIATLALIAWNWLALTVAGSPWATAAVLAREAPISAAGQHLLAAMAIVWALALAAPWPLDHFGRATVQLPALAVVLAVALRSMPEGLAAWQPIATPVLAAATVVAAFRRRWDAAAGALVVLGATRPGALGVAGALAIALVPIGSRVVRWPAFWTAVAGVATALVLSATLRDEVLVTVVLGLGVAAAAQYADRVVAPI